MIGNLRSDYWRFLPPPQAVRPSLFGSHSRSPSWLALPGLFHWDGETLGGNIAGPLRGGWCSPREKEAFSLELFPGPRGRAGWGS